MSEPKLKRNLSFVSMVALASGAVIGGWLAEAPYWFSVTGAGAAIIFPLLAILLIPISGQQMLSGIKPDGPPNG